MNKLLFVTGTLTLAASLFGQGLDSSAIERQQRRLSDEVTTLCSNWLATWIDVYPHGAPFVTRDKDSERQATWSPKLDIPKGLVPVNTGLGCITFIVPNDQPGIPDNCAPVDVQARLAMETLREYWENGRNVPEGKDNEFAILHAFRNHMPELWSEEKALYCVLRPDAQYIDLYGDALRDCTPKENK
jgi:hypothetical protein